MLDFNPSNPKQASTKSLVFLSLSRKFPSSIAEITRSIKEDFKVKIGYQTVRKAVNAMVLEGLIGKEESVYTIDHDWLLKTKGVVDSLLLRYQVGGSLSQGQDYSVFTANSLYEADNLWSKLLLDISEDALAKGDRSITCLWHYSWWLLINFGQETNLFAELKKRGHKITQHVFRDLPLNRWAVNVYREIGVEMRLAEATSFSDLQAFNVAGEYVLQVTFTEKIMRKIRALFNAYSDAQSIPPRVIRNLVHAPCLVQFAVFCNRTVAESIVATQGLSKGQIVKKIL